MSDDNKEQSNENVQFSMEDRDYVKNFTTSYLNMLNNPLYYNPYLLNDVLKQINYNPHEFNNREKVIKLLTNPSSHELELRQLSQYLYSMVMPYKRLVDHFASLLTFDWYIVPVNKNFNPEAGTFQRAYNKAVDFVEAIKPKETFPRLMKNVILEDTKYYYLRESDTGYYLQEMPSEWCKITSKTDYGWQYSINMTYFLRLGTRIDTYPDEFKDYFNEFLGSDEYKKMNGVGKDGLHNYYYWKELDPRKAFVFKWDESHAGVLPPFMSTFLDAIEITNYKELMKTKTQLETWKLLVGKIPMLQDSKGANKDNFAINSSTAGQFQQLIQSTLPDGTKIMVSPFDIEAIDFSKSGETRDKIVGVGEHAFWRNSGTTDTLFGENVSTQSGINASIKTDVSFVDHMYRQFERFINLNPIMSTGRYKFRIVFEGNRFDVEERFDRAYKAATVGGSVSKLASAMGMSPNEFMNLTTLEDIMGWKDKLKPLQTAHTIAGNEGGRPETSDGQISDAGEKTRDGDTNSNRN